MRAMPAENLLRRKTATRNPEGRGRFCIFLCVTLLCMEELCWQEGQGTDADIKSRMLKYRVNLCLPSPPDSPETIGRRVTMGIGICLAILILAIWGVKFQQKWKRTRSQQGLQENSSGQSFFVRNKKVRRTPLSEGPHSLGCYNPMMEDGVSYAVLRFPETDTARTRDAGTSETQGRLPNDEDMVTYSEVQRRRVGDYENVAPDFSEDEGIHYSELVQFGAGERPRAPEDVEYVTLKH